MNSVGRVDEPLRFANPRSFPAHHLVEGAGAGEIAGGGMSDLPIEEMDLAPAFLRRTQMQDRRGRVQALQGNQVAHI